MAEVLVRYSTQIIGKDGLTYQPQACGGVAEDGLWEGWLEFVSAGGAPVRTGRETEQPNRDSLIYWAEGLTGAYIEGALDRALAPKPTTVIVDVPEPSVFSGPKPPRPAASLSHRAVLDPFATYDQGEDQLRRQLTALSKDNLVNIIKEYRLAIATPTTLTQAQLVDAMVLDVRRRNAA